MKTAVLFPGQGSQFVGHGAGSRGPVSRPRGTSFLEANEVLGEDLARICFEGPEEELRQTSNTQPAIYTHSVAVLRALGLDCAGDGFRTAGHSLGEYTAYHAAGSLSFADGLRLVRRRGELMYQAGLDRPGTMAAVLGMEGARVRGDPRRGPGHREGGQPQLARTGRHLRRDRGGAAAHGGVAGGRARSG